jgi:carboxyl-terminal processing protease
MRIAAFLMTVLTFNCLAQPQRDFRKEVSLLRKVLTEKHVQPRPFDDRLSQDVFDAMLEELDPDRVYFSQEDVTWLSTYRNSLDEEIKGGAWVFLARLKERYASCLKRARLNTDQLLSGSLSFDTASYFSEEKTDWPVSPGSLRDRQRDWLKLQVMDKLAFISDRDKSSCSQSFKKHRQEIINKVRVNTLRKIDEQLISAEGLANRIGSVFLQVITKVFDPHTLYLSAAELKGFIGELATENYYFGFSLEEDIEGRVRISALTPGGPAWRSGEIHVSDELLAVKKPSGAPIDISDLDFDDVNELMGSEEHVLDFTVRKADGTDRTVTLTKEKMEAEENFVRSFLIQGDKRFGYIHLPDFYTKWGSEDNSAQCANDVAREIIKLKKDAIEGLILDLRYNKGGSLYEAMAMAGIFINEGALGILKNRTATLTLKDMNRGTVYDGPLVIMVNGHSASASELLSAAIQDYNRGLIVGSRTYGKATGQQILPVSPVAGAASLESVIDKSHGFIKITTEKLYRVNGKSLQGEGVVPDVLLPDMFDVLDFHEKNVPFALSRDSVVKNTFYKPLPPINRAALQQKSADRVKNSDAFLRIRENMAFVDKYIADEQPVPLRVASFCEQIDNARATRVPADALPASTLFVVSNNSAEKDRLQVDDYADAYNRRWFENLPRDPYLVETYLILKDLINHKNP